MRAIILLLLITSIAHGQFDERLKSLVRTDTPAVDINRMFSAADWQIRISDPMVKRIDLQFSFLDEIVAETWLIDEANDPERILDIAIGPLNDIKLGSKWRIYAGIRGRSEWWNGTVNIPAKIVGKKCSYSGGPVLQNDGSFGLIFFDIPSLIGQINVPLKVRVTLSYTKEKSDPAKANAKPHQ